MDQEGFGFSLVTGLCDSEEIERAFFENARYAEYAYQSGRTERRKASLRGSITGLLRELPLDSRLAVTDDEPSLTREVVAARNWFAHGNYDLQKPSTPHLLRLSLKLGVLLWLIEILRQFGTDAARRATLDIVGNDHLQSVMAAGTACSPRPAKFHQSSGTSASPLYESGRTAGDKATGVFRSTSKALPVR